MVERGGGKGANRAFAAARAGADVALLAAVGADGADALADFESAGVNLSGVIHRYDTATGRAVILPAEGENTIVVNPGANGSLSPEHVYAWADSHAAPQIVLVQYEVQQAVVDAAIQAFAHLSRVLINASPTGFGSNKQSSLNVRSRPTVPRWSAPSPACAACIWRLRIRV